MNTMRRGVVRVDSDYVKAIYPEVMFVSHSKIMMAASDLIANEQLEETVDNIWDAMDLLEDFGIYTFVRH